ncbi:hypothetical protein [Limimaricola hongkongensis]|nr:hypothetical protein [Limimaricola hongkongensis]
MNIGFIRIGNRVAYGPIRARRRNRITIICDGRPLTGLAAPKKKRSK